MRGTIRLLVGMSLAFGLSYPWLWDHLPTAATAIVMKGAGVGLLALAAGWRARDADGRLLAGVMALGAIGDVLLEISLAAGAAAFAAGHAVAIFLYRRNRRAPADRKDRAIAALIPIAAAVVPFILLQGRAEALPFTAYALLLGAMASSAWLSRFPRGLVAMGALLFLASDMLIALRMASGSAGLGVPIWLLYYVGQLLIFVGVSSFLPPRGRSPGGGGPAKVVEG
ncbi:MAG TPA: lysoplasmalogenase family protein [Allosphingosinicella sp.]|nr:lysoplasmalogenase family protein [Allosphingosinicella sp.]